MNRYKILIEGSTTSYFFNELLKLNINIYYIDKKYKKITLIIDKKDYKKLLSIKTSCKIKILNKYGFIKYKMLVETYNYITIFFITSILILFYISNLILNIKVYGNNKYANKYLYSHFNKYKYKIIDNKENLKNKILKDNKNLSYLEIKKNGTLLKVFYKYSKKYKTNKSKTLHDVVALKDAIVLKIESEEGEVQAKKYDYVKKGDILISGIIKNKDEEVKRVNAKGKVIGEVWYKVKISVPKNYSSKRYISLNKRRIFINFLNKKYYNFKEVSSFNTNKIITNTLFPIYIGIGDLHKIKYVNKNYKIKEIDKKKDEIIENKFKKDNIIDKKVLKKYDYDSKIVYVVFIRIKEDITSYKEIK